MQRVTGTRNGPKFNKGESKAGRVSWASDVYVMRTPLLVDMPCIGRHVMNQRREQLSSEMEAVHGIMPRITSDGGQTRSYGWGLLGEDNAQKKPLSHSRNCRC